MILKILGLIALISIIFGISFGAVLSGVVSFVVWAIIIILAILLTVYLFRPVEVPAQPNPAAQPAQKRFDDKPMNIPPFIKWAIGLAVSYIITMLALAIVGAWENMSRFNTPLWVTFVVPALPFMIALFIHYLKKITTKKDTKKH